MHSCSALNQHLEIRESHEKYLVVYGGDWVDKGEETCESTTYNLMFT